MRRVVLSVVLAMVVLAIVASPAALGAEARVAVLDLDTVISESDAGREANAELEALIAKKQAEVDEQGALLEKFAQELDEQFASITADEQAAKQDELERLAAEYQQAVAEAEAEIQTRAQELRNQILAEIGQVLQIIGQQDGYVMILDISLVHYYSKIIDITYEVVRKYNALRVQ